jgi:hypothetical protein
MTNIQSPGSQSSKGSLDQEYISPSAPTVPDVLANFISNNYGNNNYYVADFESNFLRQMLTCDNCKLQENASQEVSEGIFFSILAKKCC